MKQRSVKQEVISFKVDDSLAEVMRGVPNRSDFIRSAILAALDSVCPVCMGTGILSTSQKDHWEAFAASHPMMVCPDCEGRHMTCENSPAKKA